MESIKFMAEDMAKALSERLIHAPKTKQVMDKIYVAALNGKREIFLSSSFLPTFEVKSSITIFFMGLGYDVQDKEVGGGIRISW